MQLKDNDSGIDKGNEAESNSKNETFMSSFIQKIKAKFSTIQQSNNTDTTDDEDEVEKESIDEEILDYETSEVKTDWDIAIADGIVKWKESFGGRYVKCTSVIENDEVIGWEVEKDGDTQLTASPIPLIQALFIASAYMEQDVVPVNKEGKQLYRMTMGQDLMSGVEDVSVEDMIEVSVISNVAQYGVFIDPRDAEVAFETARYDLTEETKEKPMA